ncbi:hypothetical protein ES703_66211 [subsurface metagenome]
MKPTKTASEKIVDDFVEHFHNGDYKINREAHKIQVSTDDVEVSLLNRLSESIFSYTMAKSNVEIANDDVSINNALIEEAKWRRMLLFLITHARNTGMITESVSMTSKLKKLEQENFQLKEQITKLRQLNEDLARENRRLHKLFPDSQKINTEYGDVE